MTSRLAWSTHLAKGDAVHLHRGDRSVVLCRHLGNLHHDIEARLVNGSAENRMLGLSRAKPVQEVVVDDVHEELRTARVGLSSVCHAEGAWFIGNLCSVFVLDVASIRTSSVA